MINFCLDALLLGYAEGSNPIDSQNAQKTVTKSDWESLVRQLLPGSSRQRASAAKTQTGLPVSQDKRFNETYGRLHYRGF